MKIYMVQNLNMRDLIIHIIILDYSMRELKDLVIINFSIVIINKGNKVYFFISKYIDTSHDKK